MQMRKGTRSCLSCRRRKVRCWYSSPEARVCGHCARRKTACVPQGDIDDIPHVSVAVPDPQLPQVDAETATDPTLAPFFKALHQLRQHVQESLGANVAPRAGEQRSPSESLVADLETVQSNCAPVIKLLNHQLISRRRPSLLGNHDEPRHQTAKSPLILYEMCTVLPSDPDIAEILTTRSQWWGTWRRSFELSWGEEEDTTLTQFATRAVCAADPSLLGSLLLCFALSTGNYNRYLSPLERWMLADDFRATHAYDFQCLMGLGLCLLSALQPRRAWIVYRKANTLLQLAGVHRSRRRSESLDRIFWQLFGADRWVSLLIGLPHSVPDYLCYLPIAPIDQSTPVTFHHRHMVLLTGRVIDCLQSPSGFSFTDVVSVDEEIDKVTAQLPENYLSVPHITACLDSDERSARLYRIAEVSQLKTFLYLPLFLQQCESPSLQKPAQGHMVRYGQTACLSSARSLLEAFLVLFDMDPATRAIDNSMKLSSFTALTAAVVLFLNLLADSHPITTTTTMETMEDSADFSTSNSDGVLISRAAAVFEACSEGQPGSLCGQCHTALAELISSSQTLGRGESHEIQVPYFGAVEIIRKDENTSPGTLEMAPNDKLMLSTSSMMNHDFPSLAVADDMFFSYHGPWESHQQDSGWPNDSAGLDSTNVVLDCYLASEFPM